MRKMHLKRLIVDHCKGCATIDPESLVGRYASLQHLELGCQWIAISEVKEPQALVPLEGQSCNLILRTEAKLWTYEEDRLLSLGFTPIPSTGNSERHPHVLNLQYGAPERALPLQSILPSLYDPFLRNISTSFARDSEEHALLTDQEYQAFLL